LFWCLKEIQLQRMRQLAVVPPMLLDKEERRVVFINNNGFIMDPFAEFKVSRKIILQRYAIVFSDKLLNIEMFYVRFWSK